MFAIAESVDRNPASASTDTSTFAIPSWWSGILFHVLSPRQVSLYLYLRLSCDATGSCHPTTKQIRRDLGLASLTIVFEAMSALEQHGFVLRRRRNFPELKSRRNVYRLPSCEFTMLRLVESSLVDGSLRPTPGALNEFMDESRARCDDWIRGLLGADGDAYSAAGDAGKRQMLLEALRPVVAATSPPEDLALEAIHVTTEGSR